MASGSSAAGTAASADKSMAATLTALALVAAILGPLPFVLGETEPWREAAVEGALGVFLLCAAAFAVAGLALRRPGAMAGEPCLVAAAALPFSAVWYLPAPAWVVVLALLAPAASLAMALETRTRLAMLLVGILAGAQALPDAWATVSWNVKALVALGYTIATWAVLAPGRTRDALAGVACALAGAMAAIGLVAFLMGPTLGRAGLIVAAGAVCLALGALWRSPVARAFQVRTGRRAAPRQA